MKDNLVSIKVGSYYHCISKEGGYHLRFIIVSADGNGVKIRWVDHPNSEGKLRTMVPSWVRQYYTEDVGYLSRMKVKKALGV